MAKSTSGSSGKNLYTALKPLSNHPDTKKYGAAGFVPAGSDNVSLSHLDKGAVARLTAKKAIAPAGSNEVKKDG